MSKRVLLFLGIAAAVCALVLPALGQRQPRVLTIGDSIQIYYFPYAKELVGDRLQLISAGHTEGTRYGLANLQKRLEANGGHWDVIHFNWGLHDVKDHRVVPIEEYEENLRGLVGQLKATNARLIWATTTPVGMQSGGNAGDRQDTDVQQYNAVALAIMKENQIPVDDLYAVAMKEKLQQKDGVHFTDEGSKVLARSVAESILAVLRTGAR